MKKHYLAALLFLFYVGDAAALPDCPPSGVFDNCYGTYEWDTGDKYIGDWKDDKMHGQGTYRFASGDNYVGEFKDNNRGGQGNYFYVNGDKYVGMFKDSMKHGQGTYFFGPESEWSGDKYVGEYKDDMKHGQGTYFYADGTNIRGFFSNDAYVPYICEEMGLKKGSDGYTQCVIKLMDD